MLWGCAEETEAREPTNDAMRKDGGLELRACVAVEKTTEEQSDIQTDERARRSSATFTSFASSGAGAVARTGYEHASFSDAGKVEFRLGEPEDLQFGDAVAWLREHKFDESLEVAEWGVSAKERGVGTNAH